MSPAGRNLRVAFETAEAFRREYQSNLANGGIFVATEDDLALRERVSVEVALLFCDRRLVLQGEVVHRVTPEMAQMGAPVGVAVQFDGQAHHVRAQLEPLRAAAGADPHKPKDSGRRRAPRTPARVQAKIDATSGEVAGLTRDLSQTGVLVSVPGQGVPVGDKVRLSLTHPTTGESMEMDGIVVRELGSEAGVSALAVEFAPKEAEREAMQEFVEGIQTAEHARRLGGINGDIAELGVEDLLQMFGSTGHAGTLTLRLGQDEGVIGFEKGVLRFVRLRGISGMKALVRLCAWKQGTFEFHARLDAVEEREPPLPFEAALFDAMRMLDEVARSDAKRLPANAKPRMVGQGGDQEGLTKTEAAVLDLVRAGFTLQRMVDVIPDPDPEIYRALESLCDRGVVAI